jgi:two-component system, cell cycle sensor histidine kinase and response regulator CckA
MAVLLVDDDRAVLPILASLIEVYCDETVYVAASPLEAQKIFQERQESIRVLITDMVMPHMTGSELALDLLSKKPTLKVLMVSGNRPGCLNSKIPLEPGRNFFQKPVKIEDLRTALQSV